MSPLATPSVVSAPPGPSGRQIDSPAADGGFDALLDDPGASDAPPVLAPTSRQVAKPTAPATPASSSPPVGLRPLTADPPAATTPKTRRAESAPPRPSAIVLGRTPATSAPDERDAAAASLNAEAPGPRNFNPTAKTISHKAAGASPAATAASLVPGRPGADQALLASSLLAPAAVSPPPTATVSTRGGLDADRPGQSLTAFDVATATPKSQTASDLADAALAHDDSARPTTATAPLAASLATPAAAGSSPPTSGGNPAQARADTQAGPAPQTNADAPAQPLLASLSGAGATLVQAQTTSAPVASAPIASASVASASVAQAQFEPTQSTPGAATPILTVTGGAKLDASRITRTKSASVAAAMAPDAKASNPQASIRTAAVSADALDPEAASGDEATSGDDGDPAAPDASASGMLATEFTPLVTTQAASASQPGSATPPSASAADLAAQMAAKVTGGASQFRMQLNPFGLGQVDVTVSIGADRQLTASLAFADARTASALSAHAGELKSVLEQAGFTVPPGGFDFSAPVNAQTAAAHTAQTGAGSSGGFSGGGFNGEGQASGGRAARAAFTTSDALAGATGGGWTASSADSRLDIRI